jgi:hypothetical protein
MVSSIIVQKLPTMKKVLSGFVEGGIEQVLAAMAHISQKLELLFIQPHLILLALEHLILYSILVIIFLRQSKLFYTIAAYLRTASTRFARPLWGVRFHDACYD